MSIKERLKQMRERAGVFCVVGGMRLDGKSTLAGTLPGKTLLLQAEALETGSGSAKALAKQNNHDLDVIEFNSYDDLMNILQESELRDYNNVYIDGISAVNELRYKSDDVQKAQKKNIWDAFRILGDDLRKFLLRAKGLTTAGQNVFVTLAYKPKLDANGNLIMLDPDVKGQVTINEIQRLCPIVLAVRKRFDEEGEIVRELLTKSTDVYPARIDDLLDNNNPGVLAADLGELFKLLK